MGRLQHPVGLGYSGTRLLCNAASNAWVVAKGLAAIDPIQLRAGIDPPRLHECRSSCLRSCEHLHPLWANRVCGVLRIQRGCSLIHPVKDWATPRVQNQVLPRGLKSRPMPPTLCAPAVLPATTQLKGRPVRCEAPPQCRGVLRVASFKPGVARVPEVLDVHSVGMIHLLASNYAPSLCEALTVFSIGLGSPFQSSSYRDLHPSSTSSNYAVTSRMPPPIGSTCGWS